MTSTWKNEGYGKWVKVGAVEPKVGEVQNLKVPTSQPTQHPTLKAAMPAVETVVGFESSILRHLEEFLGMTGSDATSFVEVIGGYEATALAIGLQVEFDAA